jgi:GDP-mannose transporter
MVVGETVVHADVVKAVNEEVGIAELICVLVACVLCGSAFVAEKALGKEYARGCALVGFMACSGCLLLVNKLAVFHLQMPTTIVFLQLVFTAVFVGGASKCQYIEAPSASPNTIIAFAPVAGAFLLTVVLSSKILQYANVEAMIIVRALALVVVAGLDRVIFGKIITWRSVAALMVLLMTSAAHAKLDGNEIELQASWWIFAWYGVFCFDQIYIKAVITKVKLPTWSNVFYTNALSSFLVLPLVGLEIFSLDWSHVDRSPKSLTILAGSCLLGLAMSYFSFAARSAFSATYFTLLGNVCKLLTIALNNVVWSHHSSLGGTVAVLIALSAAYFYQEAPKPKEDPKEEEKKPIPTKSGKQPFDV